MFAKKCLTILMHSAIKYARMPDNWAIRVTKKTKRLIAILVLFSFVTNFIFLYTYRYHLDDETSIQRVLNLIPAALLKKMLPRYSKTRHVSFE